MIILFFSFWIIVKLMCLTMDNDQILVKNVHNKCITILETKELMDYPFFPFDLLFLGKELKNSKIFIKHVMI
jgi:hypothetical protein